ncbi:MAG: hypothetical protein V2A70_08115 [Candidatus Omnitrophota bacterium]
MADPGGRFLFADVVLGVFMDVLRTGGFEEYKDHFERIAQVPMMKGSCIDVYRRTGG